MTIKEPAQINNKIKDKKNKKLDKNKTKIKKPTF